MRINLSSGDVIQEFLLDLKAGQYERDMPMDVEILSAGTKGEFLKLFGVSKNRRSPLRSKVFLVHPSNEPLPRSDFQYYFYIGTAKGLHVFEVV